MTTLDVTTLVSASGVTSASRCHRAPNDSAAHDPLSTTGPGFDGTTGNTHAGLSCLAVFSGWYEGVHGYVSIAVCVFGIAANVTNIAVLTRKSMKTPTNCLLTALASADMLTMASYLPYAVYFHCISAPDESLRHSRGKEHR